MNIPRSTLLDEKPVITISDVVDVKSDDYKNTRNRIEALLAASVPDGHVVMPSVTLVLGGSPFQSHVANDFFMAAHAMKLSFDDINTAIDTL